MPILNYTDLEQFMGRTFTQSESDAAVMIISSLENELQYTINRPLGAKLFTSEVHRLEPNQRQIFLRNAPVKEVTALSVGLPGEEVAQNVDDFDIYPWGIDNVRIAGTGNQALVTYKAGMTDSETVALERILLTASAREMGKFLIDAQGLARFKVEGTEYLFVDGGEGGFTQRELESVKRFKRRVIR